MRQTIAQNSDMEVAMISAKFSKEQWASIGVTLKENQPQTNRKQNAKNTSHAINFQDENVALVQRGQINLRDIGIA